MDSPFLRVHAIEGNRQRLDGGAMFGNAPRAVWAKWCPPDDQGRIDLACRAALVESGTGTMVTQRVLLETGIGAFFSPKLRERFGVVEERHVLLDSLATLGLTDADIDAVVLSHLHFDHAGGLLSTFQPDAPLRLLFPRAQFIVGRTAWERAVTPHARDRASFIPELQGLLESSGRLVLVSAGEEPLGPAFRFTESHGHTPGMLHTWVTGPGGDTLFFCADLVPGTPWVHVPITMGYDRAPEILIDEKEALFADLLRRNAWLFFTHDKIVQASRLERSAEGRYTPATARPANADALSL